MFSISRYQNAGRARGKKGAYERTHVKYNCRLSIARSNSPCDFKRSKRNARDGRIASKPSVARLHTLICNNVSVNDPVEKQLASPLRNPILRKEYTNSCVFALHDGKKGMEPTGKFDSPTIFGISSWKRKPSESWIMFDSI